MNVAIDMRGIGSFEHSPGYQPTLTMSHSLLIYPDDNGLRQ
jgi:hypothetical protein